MPPNNYDPAVTPPDSKDDDAQDDAALEGRCPKCAVEMEPIEMGVDGPRLERLQLCPKCYLVIWSDPDGLHVRQGVPMGRQAAEGANPYPGPGRLAGDPEEC